MARKRRLKYETNDIALMNRMQQDVRTMAAKVRGRQGSGLRLLAEAPRRKAENIEEEALTQSAMMYEGDRLGHGVAALCSPQAGRRRHPTKSSMQSLLYPVPLVSGCVSLVKEVSSRPAGYS